jgi:predicted acetyltransferase
MTVVLVEPSNRHVYRNLAQCYEAEFSRVMPKLPDSDGLFALETELRGPACGYLYYQNGHPIGLSAVMVHGPGDYEIREFYIVPACRRSGAGFAFAHALFRMYRGDWQIKQVKGTGHATRFWREAIRSFGAPDFQEDQYEDRQWGLVTRQTFSSADNL